jgi:hypothetical protein
VHDETTGTDIVAVDVDAVDQYEDDTILGIVAAGTKAAFVYEFPGGEGGKPIRGLTVQGIDEAANYRGGIDVDRPDVEETDVSYVCMVKVTDTRHGSSRWGCFEQPKEITLKKGGTRPDPHARIKAVSKAQRNALRKILPQKWQQDAIAYLCGEGAMPQATRAEMRVDDPAPVGTDRKATFSQLKELMPALSTHGITLEVVADAFRRNFGVTTRANMTEENWAELAAKVRFAQTDPRGLDLLVGWVVPEEADKTTTIDEDVATEGASDGDIDF